MEIIKYTEEHKMFRNSLRKFLERKSFPMLRNGRRPG